MRSQLEFDGLDTSEVRAVIVAVHGAVGPGGPKCEVWVEGPTGWSARTPKLSSEQLRVFWEGLQVRLGAVVEQEAKTLHAVPAPAG